MRKQSIVATAAIPFSGGLFLLLTCSTVAQESKFQWTAVGSSQGPVAIRAVQYVPESSGNDWSIRRARNSATDITRFEVRAGDQWDEDRASGENKERSEFDGYKRRFAQGTDVWGAYAFLIEPGAEYRSDWNAISQMHGSKARPFHIHFKQGNLIVYTEYVDPNSGPATKVRYSGPVSRNTWHNIVFHLRESESDGRLEIWLNGTKIVNFAGPIGKTGNEAYWKFGVYRGYGPVATPFAIEFANMEVGASDLAARIQTPLPIK